MKLSQRETRNIATEVVRANCHLNVEATVRNCARLGRLSLFKGEGEGEGCDVLRQMTPVALEPLTSRLRSATARQAVLFPSKGRGGSTLNMNQVRMDLTT
jgi:hypothetical protein